MAKKKRTDEEPVIVPPAENPNVEVPPIEEVKETLEEVNVVDERKAMPDLTAQATTDLGGGLAGERPAPQKPVIPTAPISGGQSFESLAEQMGQESLQTPPREIQTRMSPEELRASQRAAADAAMRAPTFTAEKLAEQQAKASLEENKPDFPTTVLRDSQGREYQSTVDYLQGIKDDYEREKEAAKIQIEADNKAAKYTGYTELGAAIANLVGVAEGNAVSQQYKSFSQDWMKKADQDMREHRSRIDNLRQRQRDTELKMAQIKAQNNLNLAKFEMQREQDRIMNEYRKAQAEYQNARTEAARRKADQDAREAEEKLKYIRAQVAAQEALARQRGASAQGNLIRANATAQNANSRASSVENQNENRNSRTGAQNELDRARTGYYWSRASGQPVYPQAGWGVQAQPQNTGNSGTPKRDSTGLGDYK